MHQKIVEYSHHCVHNTTLPVANAMPHERTWTNLICLIALYVHLPEPRNGHAKAGIVHITHSALRHLTESAVALAAHCALVLAPDTSFVSLSLSSELPTARPKTRAANSECKVRSVSLRWCELLFTESVCSLC